jgi:hypothetical protein
MSKNEFYNPKPEKKMVKLYDILVLMSKQYGSINEDIANFYEKIEARRIVDLTNSYIQKLLKRCMTLKLKFKLKLDPNHNSPCPLINCSDNEENFEKEFDEQFIKHIDNVFNTMNEFDHPINEEDFVMEERIIGL